MNLNGIIQEEINKYLSDGVIKEELLGDYTGHMGSKTSFEIYKNPKSIIKMDDSMRGIVDSDGNLYVATAKGDEKYSVTLHMEIGNFLREKGLIPKNYITDGALNYIGVHRHGNTNDFYLGESISYTILSNDNYKKQTEEIFKKAKQKNPTLDFIMHDIWGDR